MTARLARRRVSMTGWGYLVLPGLFVLLVTFVLPIANLAWKSLHQSAGLGRELPGLTLHNYIVFISDPFYWKLMGLTATVGAIVVAASLVLGFPLAYFIARSRTRWRNLVLVIVIAPMLVSVVIRNLGWIPVLGEVGVINWLLTVTGLISSPVRLLNNLLGVIIGLVHALMPFLVITLMTVIQRIDPALEEASVNLGASRMETFWRVILPLARTGVIAGTSVVFALAISAYTTPAIMGGGRVLVMSTYIQQEVVGQLDYATGSTVSLVLMAFGIALSIFALRFGKAAA